MTKGVCCVTGFDSLLTVHVLQNIIPSAVVSCVSKFVLARFQAFSVEGVPEQAGRVALGSRQVRRRRTSAENKGRPDRRVRIWHQRVFLRQSEIICKSQTVSGWFCTFLYLSLNMKIVQCMSAWPQVVFFQSLLTSCATSRCFTRDMSACWSIVRPPLAANMPMVFGCRLDFFALALKNQSVRHALEI